MSDTKESLSDITTIQPERLIKYRISEDRFSGEVLLPGLWYTDFDKKNGKWTLSSLCESLEVVNRSVLCPRGAFFMRDLQAEGLYFVFIVKHDFSIRKQMHNLQCENVWGYYKPYRFVLWLAGIGKTSFSVCQEMYDYTSNIQLYSATTRFVHIDGKTRKPCLLPDWFTDKANEFLKKRKLTSDHMLEKSSVIPVPKNAFSYELKGLPSDCDKYLHVSQTTYVRWCSDVGSLAANMGKYKCFTKDIGMYALQELTVQYIGETLVGETVEIHTWEDENDDKTLYFSMKKNEKFIFHAKLKHYDDVVTDTTTTASDYKL